MKIIKKNKAGLIVWLTGLSGSGKSTIATHLKEKLAGCKISTEIIDGDVIRKTTHKHLGFSASDIIENNRMIVEYCLNEIKTSSVILVPVIAPFEQTRIFARKILKDSYIEIYVKASLETCIKRDTKGLYAKAVSGELKNLIGFDNNTPYEEPINADVIIDTEDKSISQAVDEIYFVILKKLKQSK